MRSVIRGILLLGWAIAVILPTLGNGLSIGTVAKPVPITPSRCGKCNNYYTKSDKDLHGCIGRECDGKCTYVLAVEQRCEGTGDECLGEEEMDVVGTLFRSDCFPRLVGCDCADGGERIRLKWTKRSRCTPCP